MSTLLTDRVFILMALAGLLCGGCAREHERPKESRPRPEATTPGATGSPSATAGHLIDATEVENLKERGLAEPLRQLVDSLAAHPEVIPHPGILGGTMGFYSKDVHVLNGEWVYARFTDGHIEGSGVFGFTIDDDGRIKWRTVVSVLDTVGLYP